MQKKFLLLYIFILMSISSYAQKLTFEYQQGMGHYQMSDLKTFNKLVLDNIPITPQLTENLPMYFYYQGEISSFVNDVFGIGAVFSLQSTGARISQKDYSGEYRLDELIRSESYALKWKFRIDTISDFKMQFYTETGVFRTTLSVDEYFELYNETSLEEYKLNSLSLYFEPGLALSYPYKIFEVGANIAYTFEFAHGDFETEAGYKSLPLNISAEEKAHSGWDGFRLGLFVRINLF